MKDIKLTHCIRKCAVVGVLACVGLHAAEVRQAAGQQVMGQAGRIAGRVLDQTTGRPLRLVNVVIEGRGNVAETDLDGRYRTPPLPAGRYTVRAAYIGYQPFSFDSVEVITGETQILDFALRPAALQLEGLVVEAEAVERTSSAAGLLAIQQAAPAVSDGISAETISRAPDSDAADAVQRVTGISVFDDKYVVVRGLPERYSNTLLNGAELASPEPSRRVVPLDIFPASLLESIVTAKTATPDKPGDFSGGSVQIETKDFPEEFVFQISGSVGYNSLSTFHEVPLVPWSGTDVLGFDDGRRALPQIEIDFPDVVENPGRVERFGESVRNVWAPVARTAHPDFGVDINLGGQIGEESPLGVVLSFTHDAKTEYTPDRLFQLYTDQPGTDKAPGRALLLGESGRTVEWGAIGNFSLRVGSSHQFGLKNLVTHSAGDDVIRTDGFDTENSRTTQGFQVKYHQQTFLQTQLSGEHFVGFPIDLRVNWKASAGFATRDEPDNRQAVYTLQPDGDFALIQTEPSHFFARFLDDRIWSGQMDWSFPVSLRFPDDTEFKIGGFYRVKDRTYDARYFRYELFPSAPNVEEISRLPPEQAFSPENIGTAIVFTHIPQFAQSYEADDDVRAAYAMLDLPLLPWARLVGGVRYEDWELAVFPGSRDSVEAAVRGAEVLGQRAKDWLWSANLTLRLNDRMNVRMAGFRSVTRPDAREVSPDAFIPVISDCELAGTPELRRAIVRNGDVRWEFYPGPGELISMSGFVKDFDNPIIETILIPGGGECRVSFRNGLSALNYGAEFEVRKAFPFLPGPLGHLQAGFNVTFVESTVELDSSLGDFDDDVPLQGQSPLLINANVSYVDHDGGTDVSVLYNYFDDRIARYGLFGGTNLQLPNWIERGRGTLDFKVRQRLGRLNLSLAGKNLTDEPVLLQHENEDGILMAGSNKVGIGFSVGLGYEF